MFKFKKTYLMLSCIFVLCGGLVAVCFAVMTGDAAGCVQFDTTRNHPQVAALGRVYSMVNHCNMRVRGYANFLVYHNNHISAPELFDLAANGGRKITQKLVSNVGGNDIHADRVVL